MKEIGMPHLAFKLQVFREDNDMTQAELAKKLNISRATLSYYENAKTEPPIYTLIKMSEVLNCSIDSLLGLEKDSNSKSNQETTTDFSSKNFQLNNLIKKNKKTFDELNLSKRRVDRMLDELSLSKRRSDRILDDLIMSKKRNDLIFKEFEKAINRSDASKKIFDELSEEFLKSLNKIDNTNLKENIKEEYAEELVPEIENTIDLEPSYKKKESFLEKYLIDLTENEKLSQKFIAVNVVGSVKCGSPAYAYKEVTSTLALPAKYKDCYLLKADGDSMNKLFHNGELIVCCPNKIPHNNDIVVAYIPEHEEATCKKLKCEHQTLELHPCSTMAYEIQRYDENSDIQIMAVVLGSLSDILEKENIDINELEEELRN
ncbi:helix-turn-helix domain-containing protein [Clostridium perfringens]|uniref:S24 family peptidase n=1 Tax=Clostridium perfringens TaxID=1502 RepID=UPI001ABA169C|nr:S24 family peptidase [Clostridium perfringens]MBO3399148.1 helix-turn-helix domain-containing protein [Clostridium perfringens]